MNKNISSSRLQTVKKIIIVCNYVNEFSPPHSPQYATEILVFKNNALNRKIWKQLAQGIIKIFLSF